MSEGADRIAKAITNKEKIAIFGDYDVDGATSTAALYKNFKCVCMDLVPIIYIPDRLKEGYGPNIRAFQYLKDEKVDLVITVDCQA